jgi:cobalt/nickel transport system permease protein
MHVHWDDRYHAGSSLIHQLDPRIKVLCTLAFVLCASLLPAGAWLHYLLLLGLVMTATVQAQLGISYTLKRSFIALPFALAAITLPFTTPGQPLATIGGLTISLEGTIRFASIVLKSWISVQMAILLVSTTRFPDLAWGLRSLGIPRVLVSIISVMYRYLFVLADEASRLMRARAARSGVAEQSKSGGSLAWRAHVTGGMIGSLGLRAFERSERIYDAMVARGYTGEVKHFAPPKLAYNDYATVAVVLTFLSLLLMTAWIG